VDLDFDRTEPQRQCLDEYLMDDSIIRIVEHLLRIKGTRMHDFYDDYPSVAVSIFSKPYPRMARDRLGYPTPDIEFIGISNNHDMSTAILE
jgi:hypothetical protein